MQKKIIILSHEASFSGAPKSLLNLSKFLQKKYNFKIIFLFTRGGPLLSEFNKIGRVFRLDNFNGKKFFFLNYLIRFFPVYRIRNFYIKQRLFFFKPNCILSNTIVNSNLLEYTNLKKTQLITVVREKKGVINLYDKLKKNNSSLIISKTSKFIAVSESVKNDLVNTFNVLDTDIQVIYNTIPFFKRIDIDKKNLLKWKKVNKIPFDSFIVGSCGGPIWRKGPDIFLNIAKTLKTNFPDEKIFFVWQGGQRNSSWFMDFYEEIKYLGLNESVIILPESEDINFFYNAIDIYISTAREEPFGLTLLEAGIYSKPCIAFKKSGGPEEILSKGTGLLLPYGDFEKASNEIVDLKFNLKRRKKYALAINQYSVKSSKSQKFLEYKKLIDIFSK